MKENTGTRRAGKSLLTPLLCLLLLASALLPAFAAGTIKTLKASAVTESSIALRWSAVKGAAGYQLQQYKDKHWTRIVSTEKTEAKVKKLSAGTAYAFRVRAVKGREAGAFSAVLRVRTAPAQVQKPVVKSAKPTQVKLQWNKVKGAEGYRLQQRTGKTWATVLTTEKRSATVRGLSPDTALRFRVAAFLKNGKQTVFGKNSSVCSVKTPALPAAPQEPPTAPHPERYERYHQIVKSGTFLLIFTTDDPALGEESITSAMKDGSAVVDTMLQNTRVRMLYDAKTDQNYMLLPDFQCYTVLSKEMVEDMVEDMGLRRSLIEFAGPIDMANARVYTVEQDGETYNVEAFFESGTQTSYYFKDETLVRIVSVEPDGVSSTVFVQTLTDEVPDSLFEIPKGYRLLNLSFLF